MVLIRKRYFVQHLESTKKRERTERKIETVKHVIRGRLSRWIRIPATLTSNGTSSSTDEKVAIHVEQSSTPDLPEDSNRVRFDPSEGIGAALVGGGSTGISLGIALRALPEDDDAPQSGKNARGPIMIHTDETHARLSVESPQEDILTGANGLIDSPQSGAIQLPTSPQSERHPVFSPTFAVPPALRHRRGNPQSPLFIVS